jgi:hypothetical protein
MNENVTVLGMYSTVRTVCMSDSREALAVIRTTAAILIGRRGPTPLGCLPDQHDDCVNGTNAWRL